ncbi:MAG TPA: hydrogenase maturation protease [Acidimicrobiales bacterium]|jgi:hydrogenase maturation protease|nr:hydrogenase maturation protease [Acidimicrobiales bacterium]
MTRRVLVAGIGNIFLSDDGFGVEVAQRLAHRELPDGVRAVDFGIRGIHLAYELLDGYDALVLIDAVPMGREPGTLAMIEPEDVALPDAGDDVAPVLDAHTMNPGVVLGMLATFEAKVGRIVIVGCEPATLDDGIGLSPPVAEAVDAAVELLEDVLTEICQPARRESPP